MSIVARLAWNDFRQLMRRPFVWMWAFVMPVFFFAFIGKVTSGFAGPAPGADRITVVVPEGAGPLADDLIRKLKELKYEVRTARAETPGVERQLVLPPDFGSGKAVTVRLVREGGGLGSDYDKVRVARAVYGLLAEVIVKERKLPATASTERAIQLKVEAAGERKKIPTGFQQAVPGSMVMFGLMVMLTSGAVTLVLERKQGLLRRLASSPMPRIGVVAAKWASRFALGLVQTAFAMLVGTVLFQVDWGFLPASGALLFWYCALCASIGVLLGSLARTEGQAIGIGTVTANAMAALGGCWWPVEILPDWMQKLYVVLPTGLTMNGLHKLITFGQPATAVLPHIGILLLLTGLCAWAAARRFRFQ